jgi:hypothetical protein
MSRQQFILAEQARVNQWLPDNGGSETPMQAPNGRTVLLVYNPFTRAHRWMDVDTETILTDEQVYEYGVDLML